MNVRVDGPSKPLKLPLGIPV